jgi:hypothetical protein
MTPRHRRLDHRRLRHRRPGAECHWSAATKTPPAPGSRCARALDADQSCRLVRPRRLPQLRRSRRQTLADFYRASSPKLPKPASLRHAGRRRRHQPRHQRLRPRPPDDERFLTAYRRLLTTVHRHPRARHPRPRPHARRRPPTGRAERPPHHRTASDPPHRAPHRPHPHPLPRALGRLPAEGLACDYHPSARTHTRMAQQLIETLRPLLR